MNQNIADLYEIAQKSARQIIGLMAGTSLDGLDIAWCEFRGSGPTTEIRLRNFCTLPFDEAFKNEIRRVFVRQTIDFQHLVLLNAALADRHAALVLQALESWGASPADIDLLASHGQTVFHAPKILHGLADWPNATFQIGDGDHLAVKTGIITLSDFRQKHVAAGGEGAPLALYGDFLLFSKPGENRVLVNIGGIANFTWLPTDGNPQDVFATDTGPGNTLLDQAAQLFFGKSMDENGQLALAGQVSQPLLNALKADLFFGKPVPKTTGPELFSLQFVETAQAASGQTGLSKTDLMATLAHFSADTLANSILKTAEKSGLRPADLRLYLSGGGAHNPAICRALERQLPDAQLFMMKELGIDGDAKEAVLFATLANEAVAGGPAAVPFGLAGQPNVSMGKISFPR